MKTFQLFHVEACDALDLKALEVLNALNFQEQLDALDLKTLGVCDVQAFHALDFKTLGVCGSQAFDA